MTDYTQEIHDALSQYLDGPALDLCVSYWRISQIWDDLHDGTPRLPSDVDIAFTDAMTGIQMNPLFQQHFHYLTAMADNVILKWKDANILERSSNEQDLLLAWGHRAGIYDLFCYIHKLVKGDGPEASAERIRIRQLYGEQYSEFLQEMEECRTQSSE